MADDSITAGVRAPSHRYGLQYHRPKIKEAVDLISSLPDEILQHILFFIPTKIAIRTSLLSKRWRHVWCDTLSLSFDDHRVEAPCINETLTHYTASRMMKFHLHTCLIHNVSHVDRWIKFAMSRNVENLSLYLWNWDHVASNYKFPDFFFINSSVKQLSVDLDYSDTMIPRCSVSWTSLKKLCLRSYYVSDESIAKILSGCPLLASLTLKHCTALRVLDLSKSLRLRTLEINGNIWAMQIVAPHINCLRLTLETRIFQKDIHGIKRVLQNSPALKKLTLLIKDFDQSVPDEHLGNYMELHGFNLDQCWTSEYGFFYVYQKKKICCLACLLEQVLFGCRVRARRCFIHGTNA